MKAVVLGTGGWGTAISQILCDNGHETYLWSHNPAKAAEMVRTREKPAAERGSSVGGAPHHGRFGLPEGGGSGCQRATLLCRPGDGEKNGLLSHGEERGGVRLQRH